MRNNKFYNNENKNIDGVNDISMDTRNNEVKETNVTDKKFEQSHPIFSGNSGY